MKSCETCRFNGCSFKPRKWCRLCLRQYRDRGLEYPPRWRARFWVQKLVSGRVS